MTRVHQVGPGSTGRRPSVPIRSRRRKNKRRASVLSGKDIQHRTMKNMNKSFSRSLREQLREGMIYYAAACNCLPIDMNLIIKEIRRIMEEKRK